jgi:hypothetical protein
MGLFNIFRRKPSGSICAYSGGGGRTYADAIVIHATSPLTGVALEYAKLNKLFGKQDEDWTLNIQMVTSRDDKPFDVFVIKLKSGVEETIYFDISHFYGRI